MDPDRVLPDEGFFNPVVQAAASQMQKRRFMISDILSITKEANEPFEKSSFIDHKDVRGKTVNNGAFVQTAKARIIFPRKNRSRARMKSG